MSPKKTPHAAPTWVRKGVKFTVDEHGTFTAKVGGVPIRKPSRDTMEKAIDEALRVPFEPFTIIVEDNNDKLRCVRIVAHDKGDMRNRFDGPAFIDVDGKRHPHAVAIYTPENLSALKQYRKAQETSRIIKGQREAMEREMKDSIKYVRPDDFQKGS